MMNIVWLTPEVPFPPIGGRNGVYNRIVQMSRYNKIYLFSIVYNSQEMLSKKEMEKYCEEIHFYNRNEFKFRALVKSILLPFSVASRTIPALKKDIKKSLAKNDIDLIIIDFPNMAKNIEGVNLKNIIVSVNQHNTEYKRMKELFKVKTIPFYKRIAYYGESFRLKFFEKNLYRNSNIDNYTFFSEDDKFLFKHTWVNCKADLKVFPLGANDPNIKKSKINNHDMLFVSRLDGVVGVEAVIWFAKKVLPIILKKTPDARLIVAGANPKKEIMDLEGKNIKIIPNYKDPLDVYSLTNIAVLPLLSGGGVKGKLLEAIAYRKVIVSTNHGIEGTLFKANTHVLLANNAHDFANACVQALISVDDLENMEKNAYDLFKNVYEWKKIGLSYNKYLCQRCKKT